MNETPQNILSQDICSTSGSQVTDDLTEALDLLRTGADHISIDHLAIPAQRRWAEQVRKFVDRFPDFPPNT